MRKYIEQALEPYQRPPRAWVRERWEYAALVTSSSYPLKPIHPMDNDLSVGAPVMAQLYRDQADAENGFDELKNQWGWGGFTSQNMK